MTWIKVESMNDEQVQQELVRHFSNIKKYGKRMNELGEDMVRRGIIPEYKRIRYPNIWDKGIEVED